MEFFEPPSAHVTLCHFFLPRHPVLCHSLKSGKLWHETEEDYFYMHGVLTISDYIKGVAVLTYLRTFFYA